ncbi:cytochrome P450 [Parathielavia appendiculata]|uniref:Cytochrome P450 n=1 Tax=Parathielavia appendiculata TaxID=2587402 RepID=A0AAN6U3E4_9PEZI|nr:cytochrome P450 [Parathielavia appendiculata]
MEGVPHSYLLGHLAVTGKLLGQYPGDVFPSGICTLALRQFPHLEKNGFILFDAWPFIDPMIYMFDPDISAQFTQLHSLPKSKDLKSEFRPLTSSKDLVTLDGPKWKFWRKSGEVLKIERPATSLTIDVIARSVLYGFALFTLLGMAIWWLTPDCTPPSLLKILNPIRPILQWYYNCVIHNALAPFIRQNLSTQADGSTANNEIKTVLSLAARAYLAEKPQTSSTQSNHEFASLAIPHLVMFLFAGHDTTAITLCFAYHLLHKHPSALARLCDEHDAVLGPDPSLTEPQLTRNPQLLNALPYTAAVIKKTLRLFAPAATNSHATHHLASLFPRPWEFLPERFLAAEGEELYVRKNAFRPFELGPRACIGQELAMLELKMILVVTVRVFDIESYPNGAPPGGPGRLGTYPVGHITGHPKDGIAG